MDESAVDPPPANMDDMDMSPTIDDKENDLIKREEENIDTQFCYVLRSYYNIKEPRVHSPYHVFGSYKWRLLIFPRGNKQNSPFISVFLECGGPVVDALTHPATSPPSRNWSRPAKFSLCVVHPSSPIFTAAVQHDLRNPNKNFCDLDDVVSTVQRQHVAKHDIQKDTSHTFKESQNDWGFPEFAPTSRLNPSHLTDDEYNIVLMVRIRLEESFPENMLAHTQHLDSRKKTGFVGFKNQGATCYMNSLLQTLYMLSAFRVAVYNMPLPIEGNEKSGSKLSYALQKLFYELQFSRTVVKTKKLTESFGWDTADAFTQHDVQELKLILCDELAEKMKQIAPDKQNTLSTLFQGKIQNYVECVNVDYRSAWEESFSDLSLNVKGCRDIYDSFDQYVKVEMMDGENKYRAEGHEELQDAKKGVRFLQLPPVLQLHLKRFDFDATYSAMVKINDRYEFQPEIDLRRYVDNSDGTDIYVLHSVLVHIGDVNGGHYHAFIRPKIDVSDDGPKKPSQWFKFDDENVDHATEEAAIQDNFGIGGTEKDLMGRRGYDHGLNGINGQTPPHFQTRSRTYQARRCSNAYMLQYLRKSLVPELLKPAEDSDVPKALASRIEEERKEEEKVKRLNAEQHLYMHIAVATNEDMAKHNGCDIVEWENIRPLRVKRALQLGELKQRLQNEGVIPDARRIRLWNCSLRHNATIRPDSLVANGFDSEPISDISGRGPLSQPGFHVPFHYGRHGHTYFGQEDVVRMYAEDLGSDYCLSPGSAYSNFVNLMRTNGDGKMTDNDLGSKLDGKGTEEKMETDVIQANHHAPTFPLERGKEGMLFVKYYTPTPTPRLQWLGHFVADRTTKVSDLYPLFRDALKAYQKKDRTLPGFEESSEKNDDLDITVFEEVSTDSITKLEPDRTLEQQHLPYESGSGDILVFQQSSLTEEARLAREQWDGYQDQSRGDGTDLPLGGRPLPDVNSYFAYLSHRIKIEFKDKHTIGTPDEVRSIFFELTRRDSYATARKILAGALGKNVDPNYIRFFQGGVANGTAQQPLYFSDDVTLERALPMHSHMTTGGPDHRILWYEQTEYHITEFKQKQEVPVTWRSDGGSRATPYITSKSVTFAPSLPPLLPAVDKNRSNIRSENDSLKNSSNDTADTFMQPDGETRENDPSKGTPKGVVEDLSSKKATDVDLKNSSGQLLGFEEASRSFSVLVQLSATYEDVVNQIRNKLGISDAIPIRMLDVKTNQIRRIMNLSELVPKPGVGFRDSGTELRAEPIPEEEMLEALGSEWELLPVMHLSKEKQARMLRNPQFFGVPFIVKLKTSGEPVREIRRRIQEKVGVPSEEFDTWPLAVFTQSGIEYLHDPEEVYTPLTRAGSPNEYRCLAIEHKSSTQPPRSTNRHTHMPLKINKA